MKKSESKENSRQSKVTSARNWILFGYGLAQVLRFSSNLILTRLLVPEMFGVMAIITIIRVGVYMFTEVGLKPSVIRSPRGEDPHYLGTVLSLQVIRGTILWGVIALIGYIFYTLQDDNYFESNSVYAYPELPELLIIAGITALIAGFESPKMLIAARTMSLKRVTVIELITQIISFAITVGWALIYPNIWSFIGGMIAGSITKTALSYCWLEGKNIPFHFEIKTLKEIYHFGKWLFLTAVLTFLVLNGDRILLSGILSADELGIYTVALFLIMAARDLLNKLISSVWFPLLCETVRRSPESAGDEYYKIRMKQDLVIFFISGFLLQASPLIIDILYDDRYWAAGWMMQILAISLVGVSYGLANELMLSLGYSKVSTLALSLRAITLFSSVPISAYFFGPTGALIAISLSVFSEVIIYWWALQKYNLLNIIKELVFLPVILIGWGCGYGVTLIVERLF